MKRITDKVKYGQYAKYQQKEYRIINKNNKYFLISEDKNSLEQGFIKRKDRESKFYEKEINISDLEAYYYIWRHVIYEGGEYSFEPGGKENHVLIITDNERIAYHYGIDTMLGRGEFGFFALIKDITFKEIKEKKKINGVQWWSDDEPIETYTTYKL